MFLTTRALVLREVKYKEADKILTLLTEQEGKLTVSARGVMRKGSKIAAGCQLLSFSDMTLFENRGRWTVNEAQTAEQFLGLRQDISLLALGNYFAELLEVLSDQDCPDPEVLRLGLNALFALSRGLYPPGQIKAVFELKLMCLTGYEPAVEYCCACGESQPQLPVFSLREGVLYCGDCGKAAGGERVPLCPHSLEALRYIIAQDSRRAFSFSLEQEPMERLSRLCEGYVTAQLERSFPALDYWKSVK